MGAKEGKVEIPLAQLIYGDIVYWLCVIAAIICTIGPVIVTAFPDNNVLNPHYTFSAIFKGETPTKVWKATGQGFPGPHFYLEYPSAGDAITMFGIALGCSSALWALIAAAIGGYLREKPRNYIYAAFCFWVAFIIFYAAAIR